MELGPKVIFTVGPVTVTETMIWGWIITVLLLVFVWRATRRMERIPKGAQAAAELFVETVYNMVGDTMGQDCKKTFAPYIGTLLAFLVPGSMLGLLDCRPVTADLNTTVPLAIVSFILIHFNGVRVHGGGGYVKKHPGHRLAHGPSRGVPKLLSKGAELRGPRGSKSLSRL